MHGGAAMETSTKNILPSRSIRGAKVEQASLDSRGLLTIDQAAAEAGVSRRFLQLEIERGRLAVSRLSSRVVRIRRSAWESYISRNETATR
jgi:hypothetical protein